MHAGKLGDLKAVFVRQDNQNRFKLRYKMPLVSSTNRLRMY